MSFPSTQSNLFIQYFWPLSSGRVHLYLYLVKDSGREKVHEGGKSHLTFKLQWKPHKAVFREGRMKILGVYSEIQ